MGAAAGRRADSRLGERLVWAGALLTVSVGSFWVSCFFIVSRSIYTLIDYTFSRPAWSIQL